MYWYTRNKADQDADEAAELLAVKQREEDLMAEVCHKHAMYLMLGRLCLPIFPESPP